MKVFAELQLIKFTGDTQSLVSIIGLWGAKLSEDGQKYVITSPMPKTMPAIEWTTSWDEAQIKLEWPGREACLLEPGMWGCRLGDHAFIAREDELSTLRVL